MLFSMPYKVFHLNKDIEKSMNNHQILSNLRANDLSRLNYIICVFLDLISRLCYKYKTNMQQRMLLFACSAKLIHFPKQHLCYPVQDLCMYICT